jgi:O-antigen/teichoic acid export membrane protein
MGHDEVIAQPGASKSYASHLLRGSVWMLAARWAMRMIGLVSTMILARVLAPEDFGLVAMAMLAYGLLETISYAGVDLALQRSTASSREDFDTAWTVQILQGCFIAVLLIAASPWIASYFSEPRLIGLMFWVAPRAVIDGLQNIGVVAFRKELDFAKEFRYTVVTKISSGVVVVIAALWLRNYWALVLGSLVASVIGVAISYAMHPYRPRLTLVRIREIWSFSQWLMISRVGSFLNRKCDEFVVGGYVGSSAMGSYHVANDFATLPSSELVMPIRRAMFPSLTKLTGRPEEFNAAVLASFSAIAAMCLFAGAALVTIAPEFIAVILGPKWLESVPVFRWLAIFGGLSALILVLEVPIWVSGRTSLSALQSWLELAAIAPLSWFAVRHFGVEGAAAARVAVAVAMVPVMMLLTARIGLVSFGQLLGAVWRPLVAAATMGVAVGLVPAAPGNALIALVVKLTLCALVYVLSSLALWALAGRPDGIERAALQRITVLGRP